MLHLLLIEGFEWIHQKQMASGDVWRLVGVVWVRHHTDQNIQIVLMTDLLHVRFPECVRPSNYENQADK